MFSQIRRDHLAGLFATLLGLGVLVKARQYDIGTLAHVGPGLMPNVLGALLAATGLAIMASAGNGEPEAGHAIHAGPDWRGWVCIVGSVLLFVGLAYYAGLIPATFACVFVAAMGDRQARLGSSLLLAAGITAFGVAVFSYGLHVQLPLLRKF